MSTLTVKKPGSAFSRPGCRQNDLRARLVSMVPYLVLLVTAYSMFAVTADDPYITFRYAANLLAGHGPVFNIGERVEGFTSPLHLLVCAVLLKLLPSVDILFKAKLFSLLMAGLTLSQMRRLARQAGLSERETLSAQTLVALSINFAAAAVNGLETTLDAFLVLAGLSAFLQEVRGRGGHRSSYLFFLALMARPDTLVLFLALTGVRVLQAKRQRLSVKFVLSWIGVFALLASVLFCARWLYYGSLLPNTYYAKHISLEKAWAPGVNYLLFPLPWASRKFGWIFALSFWGLMLMGCENVRRHRSGMMLIAVAAASSLFVLIAGGDWMFGWRFMVPALPSLVILQIRGIRGFAGLLRRSSLALPGRSRTLSFLRSRRSMTLWRTTWATLGCLAFAIAPHQTWAKAHFSMHGADFLMAGDPKGLSARWVSVGEYIRRNVPSGALVAYSELGYAGYINMDKRFLDTRGLTDHQIAQMPNQYKFYVGTVDPHWFVPHDPLYAILKQRHPDVIISMDYTSKLQKVLGDYRYAGSLGCDSDTTWRAPLMRVYVPMKPAITAYRPR